MRKLIFTFLILILLLIACGGGNGGESEEQKEDPTPTPAMAGDASKGEELFRQTTIGSQAGELNGFGADDRPVVGGDVHQGVRYGPLAYSLRGAEQIRDLRSDGTEHGDEVAVSAVHEAIERAYQGFGTIEQQLDPSLHLRVANGQQEQVRFEFGDQLERAGVRRQQLPQDSEASCQALGGRFVRALVPPVQPADH